MKQSGLAVMMGLVALSAVSCAPVPSAPERLNPPASSPAVLVDHVVASVNFDVITASELDQAMAFNVALGGKQDEKLRQETLEGLINRQLLLQEANRLKIVDVTDQDLQNEVEQLKKRIGAGKAFEDFCAKTGMTEAQLGRMLGERLLVERFVEKKIGLFVRVSRDEAKEYYNSHAVQFKGRAFPEVQKAIVAALSGQKLDQQVAQYLSELKSRADIRKDP